MKARKASTFRDMTQEELQEQIQEAQETLTKQGFQNSLKQLHDTSYLNILRKDIARMRTVLNQKIRESNQ